MLGHRRFEIFLRCRWQAVIFLGAFAVAGGLLAGEAVRIGAATEMGRSASVARMQEAVALDPADPQLRFRLGVAEVYSLDAGNRAQGVNQLRRATRLSPHQPRYWSALAAACEALGMTPCASRAMDRALALSPMTPGYYWDAANLDLAEDQLEPALSRFRRLLELDPSYAQAGFRLCLKVTDDPALLGDKLLPAAGSPELKIAYINFLTDRGHADSAHRLWTRIEASYVRLRFSLADTYLERLIAAGRDAQAVSVWKYLEQTGAVGQPSPGDPGNLVFNGGFERAPLNAGFGWRLRRDPYLQLHFSDPRSFRGRSALRVDFTVSDNQEDEPVFQLVPLSPRRTYRLKAEVRSRDITSDSGPRLRVVEPDCKACPSSATPPTLGTTPWHAVHLDFTTGPKTRMVEISVWRPRCRTFPTGITGSFWLDNVSLREIESPAEPVARRPAA